MPDALFVAAGGGGDVIVAAALAASRGIPRADTIVATLAWERLLVDPWPGPRSSEDFDGLQAVGASTFEFGPQTAPRAPVRSSLPRLRAELGVRIVLLEAGGGARGLRRQLGEIASMTHARSLVVVDVGGDAVAEGSEHHLLSPLADALILGGASGLGLQGQLVVAGPGLDGELSEERVCRRLVALGATQTAGLSDEVVTDIIGVLEWHPSEATALLAAAVLGLRGVAEVRDGGYPVVLSETSATTWSLDLEAAARAGVARVLLDTSSMGEADELVTALVGRSELQYERLKAARLADRSSKTREAASDAEMERAFQDLQWAAKGRGTDFLTSRRIAESLTILTDLDQVRGWLHRGHRDQYVAPLWRVQPAT